MTWTDEQVDEYVEDSIELLETAQVELEKNIVSLDLTDGTFIRIEGSFFSDDTGVVLTCNVCATGTYGKGKWHWAWANSSLLDSFTKKSSAMRKLAPLSGLEIFELKSFEADENMAWELSGMALEELGGIGIYRCQSGSTDLFVVIEKVIPVEQTH